MITRFGLVRSDTGGVESGACYPGCSPTNMAACMGISFPDVPSFMAYAAAHGENGVIMGAAMPDTSAWSALREQAFQVCSGAGPTVTAVSTSTVQGCCGGQSGGVQAPPITTQAPSVGVVTVGSSGLLSPGGPPSPSGAAAGQSGGGRAAAGVTPATQPPPLASLTGFLTSPIGIIVAFVILFLFMGGHHSK